MLSSTYGKSALSKRTYREWFQRFKSSDFDVQDRHSGRKEKIFEDSVLDASVAGDTCQTLEELTKSLGVT